MATVWAVIVPDVGVDFSGTSATLPPAFQRNMPGP